MEKSIERSDDEEEDCAPAINEDLINYSNDEEKSEERYVNDDVSVAVNIRKVVPPKLKWQALITIL